MVDKIHSSYRVTLGTDIHDFAAKEIMLRHKYTSAKQIQTSIESFIFQKYFDEFEFDVKEDGKKLLRELGYLPKQVFDTVKEYITDGTKFRMTPEQPLEYSELFFGTVDCISASNDILRIHDLKTGSIPAHIEQLEIYAALYCLKFSIKPEELKEVELRIYQNGEILYHKPTGDDILAIMNFITYNDKELNKIFNGGA